ncbi:Hypothetical protein GSB_150064, partial [Giardia duodenalis]
VGTRGAELSPGHPRPKPGTKDCASSPAQTFCPHVLRSVGAGAALGCLLHAGAACPGTSLGRHPPSTSSGPIWDAGVPLRAAGGTQRWARRRERAVNAQGKSGAVPSLKLGAVGTRAAPVTATADRWVPRARAPRKLQPCAPLIRTEQRRGSPARLIRDARWLRVVSGTRDGCRPGSAMCEG